MSESLIQDFEGALAAYAAVARRTGEPSFSDAVVSIRTVRPVDEFAASDAIGAVAKQCRRIYALVKYGSARRRLSAPEQRESRPVVSRPNPHELRFDFGPFLKRLWGFAGNWTEPVLQRSFFEPFFGLLDAKTTRLDEAGTRDVLKHLINVAGVAVITIGVVEVMAHTYFSHSARANDPQRSFVNEPAIQIADRSTTMPKANKVKFEHETERNLVEGHRILTELAAGDPVVRFVSQHVEQFRPALFDVLAASGGGFINTVEFTEAGSVDAAKSARRNKRQGTGVWSTTVSIDS